MRSVSQSSPLCLDQVLISRQIKEAFLDGATAEVFADADEGETAICVSVPYNVDDESKVDDAASVNFTVNGETAVFDCFLLAPGATFSVAPENATEANVSPCDVYIPNGNTDDLRRSRLLLQSQWSSM